MKNGCKIAALLMLSHNVFAQTGNVGIGTSSPHADVLLHVNIGGNTTKGFLVTGELDESSAKGRLPSDLGAGSHLMFFPGRGAFRAGYVSGGEWNNAEVGYLSTAIGTNTVAKEKCTAIGYSAIASGIFCVAIGSSVTASGVASTALGSFTTAIGNYSTAMGYSATASGYFSTVMGLGTKAKGFASTVLGMYNDPLLLNDQASISPTTPLFIVGNGDADIQRSNALIVQKNGNMGISNSTPGFPLNFATSTGDKISFYGNAGAHYGIGIQGYLMQLHTDAPEADIAFGYGSSSVFTETMRIRGNGNVGIGKTNPLNKMHIVKGNSGGTPFAAVFTPLVIEGNTHTYINLLSPDANETAILFGKASDAASGSIMYNNTANLNGFQFRANGNVVRMQIYNNGNAWLQGTLTQNSDARLKEDIHLLQNSLENLTQLHGYNYYWKNKSLDSSMQTGLMAQELQKLFPGLVKEDDAGMLSVNYSGLIPVMIEGIKEQQKQIDELKKLVEKLARR